MLEVCLVVYQRASKVPQILEELKNQTFQDFRVNIWNNSDGKLDVSNFPEGKLLLVNSAKNIGSKARFLLARLTTGNPIVFIDDDFSIPKNFIEYYHSEYLKYGEKSILAEGTRTFKKESYWDSAGSGLMGSEVDYVGTGGMVLDRNIIDKELSLINMPEEFNKTEDLYLSYIAREKYGMRLIKIDKLSSIVADKKDQWRNLKRYKEQAFALLRKKGWKLLKDQKYGR